MKFAEFEHIDSVIPCTNGSLKVVSKLVNINPQHVESACEESIEGYPVPLTTIRLTSGAKFEVNLPIVEVMGMLMGVEGEKKVIEP